MKLIANRFLIVMAATTAATSLARADTPSPEMHLELAVPRFHIESIRSAHNDTLFATTTVKVIEPGGKILFDSGAQTVSLGDHKGKETVTPANLRTRISVPVPPSPLNINNPGATVTWTFILTNSGHHDPSTLAKIAGGAAAGLGTALTQQGSVAIQKALSPVGPSDEGDTSASNSGDGGGSSLQGPAVAAGIAAAVSGVEALISMLTADCDGVVAQQSYKWTARDLFLMVVPRKVWTQEKGNPGTDSPSGCGDNSKYDVSFRVSEVPAAPAPPAGH